MASRGDILRYTSIAFMGGLIGWGLGLNDCGSNTRGISSVVRRVKIVKPAVPTPTPVPAAPPVTADEEDDVPAETPAKKAEEKEGEGKEVKKAGEKPGANDSSSSESYSLNKDSFAKVGEIEYYHIFIYTGGKVKANEQPSKYKGLFSEWSSSYANGEYSDEGLVVRNGKKSCERPRFLMKDADVYVCALPEGAAVPGEEDNIVNSDVFGEGSDPSGGERVSEIDYRGGARAVPDSEHRLLTACDPQNVSGVMKSEARNLRRSLVGTLTITYDVGENRMPHVKSVLKVGDVGSLDAILTSLINNSKFCRAVVGLAPGNYVDSWGVNHVYTGGE